MKQLRRLRYNDEMKTLVRLLLLAMVIVSAACTAPDRPSIPLFLAVQRGDIDQLDRHIYWGSDINAMLPNGMHPLEVAAEKGRFVMVRTLLGHGAAIDNRSADGDSALDLAILNGRTQVAELLLERGADLDASQLLLRAAQTGVTDRDVVRFLTERGADTEIRSDDADTPLIVAIRQENHRLAMHLVNQGADVDTQTADGKSALALARELEYGELINLLRRRGAR